MADDGSLGSTRGAARVEDQARVVLIDGLRGQFAVRCAFHQASKLALNLQGGDIEVKVLDPGQALAVADQELGFTVLRRIVDLVRGPEPIESDQNAAQAGHCPPGHDPFRSVGGDNGHPVALLDAVVLGQGSGDGRHTLNMIGVGDPQVALDKVFLVAVDRGFLQKLANGFLAIFEDFHGLAGHSLLPQFEGAFGAGQLLSDLFA